MGGWPKSTVFAGGATGRPKSILATHACGCSPVGPRPKYFGHEFCFCVRIILATCILATVAKITVPAKTLATEIHQFWPRTSYFGHAWPKYGRILATRNFAAKIIDNFGHLLIFWSRRTKIQHANGGVKAGLRYKHAIEYLELPKGSEWHDAGLESIREKLHVVRSAIVHQP